MSRWWTPPPHSSSPVQGEERKKALSFPVEGEERMKVASSPVEGVETGSSTPVEFRVPRPEYWVSLAEENVGERKLRTGVAVPIGRGT